MSCQSITQLENQLRAGNYLNINERVIPQFTNLSIAIQTINPNCHSTLCTNLDKIKLRLSNLSDLKTLVNRSHNFKISAVTHFIWNALYVGLLALTIFITIQSVIPGIVMLSTIAIVQVVKALVNDRENNKLKAFGQGLLNTLTFPLQLLKLARQELRNSKETFPTLIHEGILDQISEIQRNLTTDREISCELLENYKLLIPEARQSNVLPIFNSAQSELKLLREFFETKLPIASIRVSLEAAIKNHHRHWPKLPSTEKIIAFTKSLKLTCHLPSTQSINEKIEELQQSNLLGLLENCKLRGKRDLLATATIITALSAMVFTSIYCPIFVLIPIFIVQISTFLTVHLRDRKTHDYRIGANVLMSLVMPVITIIAPPFLLYENYKEIKRVLQAYRPVKPLLAQKKRLLEELKEFDESGLAKFQKNHPNPSLFFKAVLEHAMRIYSINKGILEKTPEMNRLQKIGYKPESLEMFREGHLDQQFRELLSEIQDWNLLLAK